MNRLTRNNIFIFFIFSILNINVYATNYSSLLLKAQSTVFPKIVLLDKDLKDKMMSEQIVIYIIHEAEDINTARQMKNNIINKYQEQIADKKLIIKLLSARQVDEIELATAYILLRTSPETIQKVSNFASSKQRIVFCYHPDSFEHDALISLNVKEKTYIYLNKTAISKYKISFPNSFYKIVRINE